MEQINVDSWVVIFLETDLFKSTSFSLICKMCNRAMQIAIDLKKKTTSIVTSSILNGKIKLYVDYKTCDGWGIVTKTIKNYRFFSIRSVIKNNLLVENHLIVSVKPQFISFHHEVTRHIYIEQIPIPTDYYVMLFA